MMVAAFDPSTTRFGVAFGNSFDAGPRSLVWKLPGAEDEVFDRTLSIASDSARELLTLVKAKIVFIEAPIIIAASSTHTMMSLIQLVGAVRAAASRAGCAVRMVATSTVRRHFIQAGNLKSAEAKRAVMERCRLLGYSITDDNSADACAAWDYGMSTVNPKFAPKSTPLFAGGARA